MSLAQGNNTLTRQRIEPGSPNPESDALTTRPVRPPFCICENKNADKLQGKHHLTSPFVFATLIVFTGLYFPILKFQASSHLLWLYSTWSETLKKGFLTTRLISCQNQRTNGPVNAHLVSWPSKAQNIQNLENKW